MEDEDEVLTSIASLVLSDPVVSPAIKKDTTTVRLDAITGGVSPVGAGYDPVGRGSCERGTAGDQCQRGEEGAWVGAHLG